MFLRFVAGMGNGISRFALRASLRPLGVARGIVEAAARRFLRREAEASLYLAATATAKTTATATAKTNTGVLRCAQNDRRKEEQQR